MSDETARLSSSENIGYKLVIFTSFFVPLQIIAVALRCYSRWLVVGRKWSLDDYLIMTTLIFQLILSGVGVATVQHAGVGHHLLYLKKNDPEKLLSWGKYLLTIVMLYAADINLPKLAVLILYKRIFPLRAVQIMIYVLAGLLICGTLANIITGLAACTPFEANYNPTLPGAKCIDKEEFFSYVIIPNMITDVALLVLPLPVIWNIHNTRRIKIGLTITFVIGSSGLLSSILRFVAFLRTDSFKDGTWDAVELIIWTVVEPGIYLISACMLTYRPILERIGKSRALTSLKTENRLRSKDRTGYGNNTGVDSERTYKTIPLRKLNDSGFTRMEDEESLTNDQASGPHTMSEEGRGRNAIKVTTDIQTWSH